MSETTSKKVLVVDDEQDVRSYLSAALEDAGFSVRTAVNGADALEKVKEETPDMISLDLVMPEHSGMKFFRELQKKNEWRKIPVLIVTGHARDEIGKVDFDNLMMNGPGVYLEKPVKPQNYVEKVCGLLKIPVPDVDYSVASKNTDALRSELEKSMKDADPDALQKALDALKKNK